MFIRTDKKTSRFTKKSKFGKTVEYHRTKKIYVFRCDECDVEFSRDSGHYSAARASDNFKHFCVGCKHNAHRVGIKNRVKRLNERLGEKWFDSYGYVVIRLALDAPYNRLQVGKNFSYIREHVKVMQDHLGREMKGGEVIHHIDGDKANNSISNLDVCTVQEHNKCHSASEEVVFELYKRGIVKYDRTLKRYHL